MFRFAQPKDNAVATTIAFLKAIHAKVSDETIEETLKNHPNYPSLLSVSDSLNEWKIENVSARVSAEQIVEVPTPFLAYLPEKGGMFVLVKNLENNIITWLHSEKGWQDESIDEFTKKWNGIILMAEADENSIESDFALKLNKQRRENLRLPLLLAGFIILTLLSCYLKSPFSTWQVPALLITKLFGTMISSLLLWQNIDKDNPFINNLCQIGTKANCSTILNSNAAQITSWLSWSEVGFFYFAGGFLILSNPLGFNEGILKWLSILAFPYTLWSIYYQGFIAKQWCTLCLAIQGILLMEFGISIFQNSQLIFSTNAILTVLQGFGGVILFWSIIKPLLLKSQQTEPLKNDLRRLRNNPNVFLALLHKQEHMPPISNDLEAVILGNPDAEHTLTVVTNLFCSPCAATHKDIEKLLKANENLCCQVIFSASNFEDDKRGIVSRSILSLTKDQQANALHEWYFNEDRNIEKWQKRLGIVNTESKSKTLEQHVIWVEAAKIEGTPTIYFDGFKIPKLYGIEDLNKFLKILPTNCQTL
jgi:uncharacterized membrane protein